MPQIEITDQTKFRLQALAEPLVDTYDTVIGKLMDQHHAVGVSPAKPAVLAGQPLGTLDGGRMIFSAANPPKLDFTTCFQIVIDGKQLDKSQTFWNNMVIYIVRLIHSKGKTKGDIIDMLTHANAVIGEKTNYGYKYLDDVGISIQGQDSNSAFAQAHFLAIANSIKGNVFFSWQNNAKAVYPNGLGYMEF